MRILKEMNRRLFLKYLAMMPLAGLIPACNSGGGGGGGGSTQEKNPFSSRLFAVSGTTGPCKN